MTLNHAWMLKGWLLGELVPPQIMEAVDKVIESMTAPAPVSASVEHHSKGEPLPTQDALSRVVEHRGELGIEVPGSFEFRVAREPSPPTVSAEPTPTEGKKPRKQNSMSPENRAAASARMKAMQAAKKAAREQAGEAAADRVPPPAPAKPFQPVSAEKLRNGHDEYVGKRVPGQLLSDNDWPDIKAMLAKSPDRRKIASDYDIDIEDLNAFIASCQRREQRGNLPAPFRSGA